MNIPADQQIFWKQKRNLTLALLLAWAAVTFLPVVFANQLDRIELLGWPLSFYMEAQGTLIAYLIIIGIYAVRVRQIERARLANAAAASNNASEQAS